MMDGTLQASTVNEVRYYLMVTPCPQCLKGPWEIDTVQSVAGDTPGALIQAHCQHCQAQSSFRFDCAFPDSAAGGDEDCVNPGPGPSRLIDLGQWLSLFYLMVESAAAERSKRQARRLGYRAALCLAEAMKFYPPGAQAPPESAFFSPKTLEGFRQHPGNFARNRLCDMQNKLPDLHAMGRRVQDERPNPRRPWWRFWS